MWAVQGRRSDGGDPKYYTKFLVVYLSPRGISGNTLKKRKLIVLGIISCTTGERRCGCASRASSASPLLTGRCPSSSASSLASSPSGRPPATPQWTEPCPSSSRVSCSWSLSSPTGPMPCAADDELDTEAFVWLVAVLDGEGKLLAPWCRLPYRRRGLRLQNIQR